MLIKTKIELYFISKNSDKNNTIEYSEFYYFSLFKNNNFQQFILN